MKKLSLKVDELRVDFSLPSPPRRKSAAPFTATPLAAPAINTCYTCQASCGGSCQVTCAGSCWNSCQGGCGDTSYTCAGTCHYSCGCSNYTCAC